MGTLIAMVVNNSNILRKLVRSPMGEARPVPGQQVYSQLQEMGFPIGKDDLVDNDKIYVLGQALPFLMQGKDTIVETIVKPVLQD